MALYTIFDDYPWLSPTIWIISIILFTLILQKLIAVILHRVFKMRNIAIHAENAMMLIIRILFIILALAMILRVAGIPPDIIVVITTLTGTIVGLASARSVGNIFAGLWVLITNPYHVGDYVKLSSSLEGIIEEISLNYTRITTPLNETVLLGNQAVLDKEITNYRIISEIKTENGEKSRKEGIRKRTAQMLSRKKPTILYRYPLLMTFHTQMVKVEDIHKVFNEVSAEYSDQLFEIPKYEPYKRTHLEKGYVIYLVVKEARKLFELVPLFMEEISRKMESLLENRS